MAGTTSRVTVLVVEDDRSMLEIITILLEDEGYRVRQAQSGEQALSHLREDKADLVVSDVMMPGMSGFDLYEEIRSHTEWAQIPFIFLTAKGQRADVRKGMGLGADDYLTKPFEPEELLTAVKIRLERADQAQIAADKATTDLKEAIVQTLTHEFRTPLALIVGYTQLLEETGQNLDQELFQATLRGLQEGSQRLASLVEDFLLITRLNSGAAVRASGDRLSKSFNPDWVVEEVVGQYAHRTDPEAVSWTLHLGAAGVTVTAAGHHVRDIVRRLVDNAVKFSKASGGHVSITTGTEDGFWYVEVADDGIGISREALPWIFDAFRQVDRQVQEQQGAGVGLTIVRGLAEAYGGRVAVTSTPGEGSTFKVWLPLSSE